MGQAGSTIELAIDASQAPIESRTNLIVRRLRGDSVSCDQGASTLIIQALEAAATVSAPDPSMSHQNFPLRV